MTQRDSGHSASGHTETLFAAPQTPVSAELSWWEGYAANLSGLSRTARTVLEADCKYIVERGIFGAGPPSATLWPESRVRRGLVMGSVQSGKTASMFGVTALALDARMDVVIILAGTRVSLWRQTFGRLQAQLDVAPEGPARERRRLLVPKPGEVSAPEGRSPLATLYRFEPAQIRRALREHRPLVIVAMKHADHLRALGKSLQHSVFPTVGSLDRPVHMLVLDDEADDGSILDALVEEGQDPIYGNLKQLPRAIADLWDPRAGGVAPDNLYATYVAYTATPQANFLQQDHNPLAPKDFVASLRTPYDRGRLEPRESTYFEPDGIGRFYTGGEIFYRRAEAANLCIPTGADPDEDLAGAVRAFLVAGAVLVLRSPRKLGPYTAKSATFVSREEVLSQCPRPHSMLIHPSSQVSDQFDTAADLVRWAGRAVTQRGENWLPSEQLLLPAQLTLALQEDEGPWRDWLARYKRSGEQLQSAFDLPSAADIPAWDEVKQALIDEVIPGTRISVVNSDPNADDRPEYEPSVDDTGWHAPRDLSTIFVSGNVMSRGLTLEGLTTTLFLRRSNQPFADSQMQMQRWFGYRGADLELCRLVAPRRQLDLFASYHEGDEALRQAAIQAMNASAASAPTPLVLQGREFLATGKIANLGNLPLCPGSKPFVRLINDGSDRDPNCAVLASLFRDRDSSEVVAGGIARGRILTAPVGLTDAADLIDSLRFKGYEPGTDNWQGEMWRQVRERVTAQGPLNDPRSFYRPPSPDPGAAAATVRKDCPYAISAYLRLWAACLSRHVRGLFPTESPRRRWSMVDLSVKRLQQPRFWVAIRYGAGEVIDDGPLAELSFAVRASKRAVAGGEITTTWGTRDPNAGPHGYRGDEFLDYYYRNEPVPALIADEPPWRPVGSEGLVLFYVNQLEGQAHPAVAVGVCVPLGGPDQFAAVVSTASSGV